MILVADDGPVNPQEFEANFPLGLIGLRELQKFSFTPIEESWPFVSMRAVEHTYGDEEISFVVVDPRGLIGGYEVEISQEDVDTLQLESPEDAMIYNIVTVHSSQPLHVTINLAGPLVINRRTFVGKQLVLVNAKNYSPRHLLIDQRETAA